MNPDGKRGRNGPETVNPSVFDVGTRYDEALLDPKATREACRDALDRLIRELKENYVRKCMERGWDP